MQLPSPTSIPRSRHLRFHLPGRLRTPLRIHPPGSAFLRELALGAVLGLTASALLSQTPGIQPAAAAQIEALRQDKATWSEAERKLDTQLIFALKRLRQDPILQLLPDLRTGANLVAVGNVDVEVEGRMDAGLLEALRTAGSNVVPAPDLSTARVRLPLGRLLDVAALPGVRRIRRDLGYELRVDNISEGDFAHLADLVRGDLGVDGSGMTIGVISNGIATLPLRQATGDLPIPVNVVPLQAGIGDEGTAMLEIVHDLAPGATLWFATAIGGMAQLAANIAALAAAGCDIIVDDVFYLVEAPFQDDVVAQAVNDFTDDGGLYFSAAGNSGNFNDDTSGVWEGDFLPGTAPPVLLGADVHDFGAGTTNLIQVDSPSFFVLWWSDALGASDNDYDLYLLNPTGTGVFDASEGAQDGDDDAIEAIDSQPFNDTGLVLAITRFSGSARFLQLRTNQGELAQATSGDIVGHAAAAWSFSVAAVDWDDAGGPGGTFDGSESVELFSSDGPRRVFFDEIGTPITPGNFSSTGGEVRQHPKVTAADGVATAAPGFNPFFGTSAAAPHAAAIAALVQQHSNLTPSGLEQVFAATALDIEATGNDRDSGHGILHALAAVSTVLPTGVGSSPPECFVGDLTLVGGANDGPQTFRACNSISASEGSFDDVTLIAFETVSLTPGTVLLGNGFTSAGPLAIRTTDP